MSIPRSYWLAPAELHEHHCFCRKSWSSASSPIFAAVAGLQNFGSNVCHGDGRGGSKGRRRAQCLEASFSVLFLLHVGGHSQTSAISPPVPGPVRHQIPPVSLQVQACTLDNLKAPVWLGIARSEPMLSSDPAKSYVAWRRTDATRWVTLNLPVAAPQKRQTIQSLRCLLAPTQRSLTQSTPAF